MGRRLSMLGLVEDNFIAQKRGQASRRSQGGLRQDGPDDELPVHERPSISRMSRTTVRDAYGRGSFGSGCLMARRLVEQGVTFVEVSLGGWDTHADAFETLSKRLLPELDKGMGIAGRRPRPAAACSTTR